MTSEMKLSDNSLSHLLAFTNWFIEARGRHPNDFLELANYLDDERDRGQFADHPTVNWMYGLAMSQHTEPLFSQFKDYYAARFGRRQ
jgi:hypothetical protein